MAKRTHMRLSGRVVRALAVATIISAAPAALAQDALTEAQKKAVETVVRDYLVKNPEVIAEAIQALRARQAEQEKLAARAALDANWSEIFNAPAAPVAGDVNGAVTVVEFFDYRCGVCRRVHPIVAELIKGDAKIRRVYKEWPILGPASVFAARAALASRRQGKYLQFHDAMMETKSKIDKVSVLTIAESVGIDRARLIRDMDDPKIAKILQRNYRLADTLNITGTPSFVIGDEIIGGGRDLATMQSLVAAARQRK